MALFSYRGYSLCCPFDTASEIKSCCSSGGMPSDGGEEGPGGLPARGGEYMILWLSAMAAAAVVVAYFAKKALASAFIMYPHSFYS